MISLLTRSLLSLGLCALFVAIDRAPAQNLVPNPGFETFSSCPFSSNQINFAVGWSSPNGGTPDYLNGCASFPYSVPANVWGNQPAHGGQAYIACITYGQTSNSWREYGEIQLTAPLTAGNTYQVSFWVSLGDQSSFAMAEIGAHLKAGAHTGTTSGNPLPFTPQIENPSSNVLTDNLGWTQITGSFVATGGEDHIAIGNFRDNASTTWQAGVGPAMWSVYYIDDVSVVGPSGDDCPTHVIGWSDLAGTSVGFLDTQDIDACDPAVTLCTTPVPVRAATPYAGGTAYDPRYRTAWVSDGVDVAEYFLTATRQCAARCPSFRPPHSDPNMVVSGLATSNRRPRLFQLATRPGAMEITVYDNSGRCPTLPVQCRRTLPAGAVAGGLAYDEVRDELLISVSFPSPNGWSTLLWIAPASRPCEIRCEAPLFSCSAALVTGLGFDACTRELYATDGRVTQIAELVDGAQCQVRLLRCCEKQHAPTYRGLAVRPCSRTRPLGRPCTSRPCASCPSMALGMSGDPALGTPFQITLSGAPAGANAALVLQFGPCGGGVPLPPPFCGVLYPALPAFVLQGAPAGGAPPCGGSSFAGLTVPVDPRLCGRPLCVQWFVSCGTPIGFGFGVSDALEFTLGGH